MTTPCRVAQPEKKLHDAHVAGSTIVDRWLLPPHGFEATTGVGRRLIAKLRCDVTVSSRTAREEAARRNHQLTASM